jgi:hypothetical protein
LALGGADENSEIILQLRMLGSVHEYLSQWRFSVACAVARVAHTQSVIQTGDLVVNLDTKTVEVDSQRVH